MTREAHAKRLPSPKHNNPKLQPFSFSSLKKSRLEQRKYVLASLSSFELCAMHKADQNLVFFCTLSLLVKRAKESMHSDGTPFTFFTRFLIHHA
ncbi:hypothetical protein VNO80_02183 [Phaseolus coccineus]|uniref:Uncharacterized protein n=1 Tax=Phaseolus coccineus TaxID=3886 RepID=A0AAN9NPX6_PHACN